MRKRLAQHIRKHDDHTLRLFLRRTVSAQIHLFGLILAIGAFSVLLYAVLTSAAQSSAKHILACTVFGITGLSVFGSSTLYHFISDGFLVSQRAESALNNFDHFSIYLFIAGTYTAFIVNAIKPPWDTYLLTLVWTLAALGIVYTTLKPRLPKLLQNRYISTALFVGLGWTLCLRITEAWSVLDAWGRALLIGGGTSYTVGAVIYATKRPNLFPPVLGHHEIWHISVLFGFSFHSVLILRFYI